MICFGQGGLPSLSASSLDLAYPGFRTQTTGKNDYWVTVDFSVLRFQDVTI